MKLTTSCFADGQKIPVECAFCAPDPKTHAGLSRTSIRDLSWSDLPPGTKSLVLLCHDSDVPSKPDDVNQEGRDRTGVAAAHRLLPLGAGGPAGGCRADRSGRVLEQRDRKGQAGPAPARHAPGHQRLHQLVCRRRGHGGRLLSATTDRARRGTTLLSTTTSSPSTRSMCRTAQSRAASPVRMCGKRSRGTCLRARR